MGDGRIKTKNRYSTYHVKVALIVLNLILPVATITLYYRSLVSSHQDDRLGSDEMFRNDIEQQGSIASEQQRRRTHESRDRQRPSRAVDDEDVSRLENDVAVLRSTIQSMARKNLLRKYGTGPHSVEVSLLVRGESSNDRERFVVELAPATHVPHATYHFLELVRTKRYERMRLATSNKGRSIAARVVAMNDDDDEFRGRGDVAFVETFVNDDDDDDSERKRSRIAFGFDRGGPEWIVASASSLEEENGADVRLDPRIGTVVEGQTVVENLITKLSNDVDYQPEIEYVRIL